MSEEEIKEKVDDYVLSEQEKEVKKCMIKGYSLEKTCKKLKLDRKTIIRISKKILDKGEHND